MALILPAPELERVRSGEILTLLTPLGGGAHELVAHGRFESPAEKVWRILDDVENYVNTMPKVKLSELLERKDHEVRMRVVIDTPFPLPDVSSLYNSIHTVGVDEWRREWRQIDKGFAPNSGTWILNRMPGGEGTLGEYRIQVAPKFRIPKKIINFALGRVIPDLFKQVDHHARLVSLGDS